MATTRHLGDGKYLIRHTDPAGNRHTRRVRGPVPRGKAIPRDIKRAAETFGGEIDRLVRERSHRYSTRSISFGEWCAEYLVRNRHRWTSDESFYNRKLLVKSLVARFGTVPLARIGKPEASAFHAEMLSPRTMPDGTVRSPLAPMTANGRVKTMRTIIAAAAGLYEITHPREWPFDYATEFRGEGRLRPLDEDDEKRLRKELAKRAPDLLPAWITMLSTGMRPGECMAMRWDWIDEINGVIRIGANPSQFKTKTRKPRDIPLPAGLMRWLRSLPVISDYVHPVRDARGKGGIGSRYRYWPKGRYHSIAIAAGCRWSHAYTLRHTFASRYLTRFPAEGAIYELQRVLGHASVTMTEKYTHFIPNRFALSRQAMSAPAFD